MENINNIQKPASLVIRELKDNLIKTINESGLHISLLDMVVSELYLEIHNQSEIVYAREKAEYEKLLSQSVKKDMDKK